MVEIRSWSMQNVARKKDPKMNKRGDVSHLRAGAANPALCPSTNRHQNRIISSITAVYIMTLSIMLHCLVPEADGWYRQCLVQRNLPRVPAIVRNISATKTLHAASASKAWHEHLQYEIGMKYESHRERKNVHCPKTAHPGTTRRTWRFRRQTLHPALRRHRWETKRTR
jgi:hypothetical protein